VAVRVGVAVLVGVDVAVSTVPVNVAVLVGVAVSTVPVSVAVLVGVAVAVLVGVAVSTVPVSVAVLVGVGVVAWPHPGWGVLKENSTFPVCTIPNGLVKVIFAERLVVLAGRFVNSNGPAG